jgi:hypothetical protein
MHAGEPCHRTLELQPVTDAILSVPNYGHRVSGHFSKLRINYLPQQEDLQLSAGDDRLMMLIGDRRLRKVSAAFAEVESGGGDFGIDTSDDRRADTWMFWWMPDVKYQVRNGS